MNVDVQWNTSTAENFYFGGEKKMTVTKNFISSSYLAEGLVREHM